MNTQQRVCPVCGAAASTVPRLHPFCSGACADRDLHRWLAGVYRVPTTESPSPDDSAQPDADRE